MKPHLMKPHLMKPHLMKPHLMKPHLMLLAGIVVGMLGSIEMPGIGSHCGRFLLTEGNRGF